MATSESAMATAAQRATRVRNFTMRSFVWESEKYRRAGAEPDSRNEIKIPARPWKRAELRRIQLRRIAAAPDRFEQATSARCRDSPTRTEAGREWSRNFLSPANKKLPGQKKPKT